MKTETTSVLVAARRHNGLVERKRPMNEALTLTIDETAKLLGVSRPTASRAAHAGQLPVVRLGRTLRVSRPALERLLAAPPSSVARVDGSQSEPDGSAVTDELSGVAGAAASGPDPSHPGSASAHLVEGSDRDGSDA